MNTTTKTTMLLRKTCTFSRELTLWKSGRHVQYSSSSSNTRNCAWPSRFQSIRLFKNNLRSQNRDRTSSCSETPNLSSKFQNAKRNCETIWKQKSNLSTFKNLKTKLKKSMKSSKSDSRHLIQSLDGKIKSSPRLPLLLREQRYHPFKLLKSLIDRRMEVFKGKSLSRHWKCSKYTIFPPRSSTYCGKALTQTDLALLITKNSPAN